MKATFLFPGQGSQSFGMGKDFYENSPKAKTFLDEASEFCKLDFKNLLFEENENLSKSQFTQPAIVLNSLMAYLALEEKRSFAPLYALGHSLGEFSALAVQGAFDFFTVLSLVHKRGIFMQEDCSKISAAMMVVLGLDDILVQNLCENAQKQGKQIYAANYNSQGQIVVAGLKMDLLDFESEFKQAGAKKTMLLNMSVASHCPLLSNASLKLAKELEGVLNENFRAVISNVNAKSYFSKDEALSLLKNQLVKPVLYKQSIAAIEDEVDFFVEFGANILKGLNRKITNKPTYSLTNMKDIDEFLEVVSK